VGNLSINGGVLIDTLMDLNGNKVLDVTETAGLLVNWLTVAGAIATQGPIIAAAGADTNIPISINPKGSGALFSTGAIVAQNATATPAGGVVGLALGVAGIGVYFGSGVPTVSAPQGSLYMRSDGSSTSTRAYVNTNGTTGWTAITTAT
jgi:hypothetical protein